MHHTKLSELCQARLSETDFRIRIWVRAGAPGPSFRMSDCLLTHGEHSYIVKPLASHAPPNPLYSTREGKPGTPGKGGTKQIL